MSETKLGELAAALAKAQGAMRSAEKDRTNPHFKSTYATLASVWDACREPLSSNGLAVVQLVTSTDKASVTVETRLLHVSGTWLSSALTMPVAQATAQGVGSAITYARRYALAAVVGVAPDDDDDGNEASKPVPIKMSAPSPSSTPPPPSNVKNLREPTTWEVRINEAATIEALVAIGSELSKQPKAVGDAHRALYTRRNTELSAKVGR